MIDWHEAYEYDFNNGHGHVVVHNNHDLEIGDQIFLVSTEGRSYDEDYDGFGALVTVTGFKPAHHPENTIVMTDLRSQ